MSKFETEEHHLREENVRLQRKLLLEMERREQLSRQLSESESSLEMDDERFFFCFIVSLSFSVVTSFTINKKADSAKKGDTNNTQQLYNILQPILLTCNYFL